MIDRTQEGRSIIVCGISFSGPLQYHPSWLRTESRTFGFKYERHDCTHRTLKKKREKERRTFKIDLSNTKVLYQIYDCLSCLCGSCSSDRSVINELAYFFPSLKNILYIRNIFTIVFEVQIRGFDSFQLFNYFETFYSIVHKLKN